MIAPRQPKVTANRASSFTRNSHLECRRAFERHQSQSYDLVIKGEVFAGCREIAVPYARISTIEPAIVAECYVWRPAP